MSQESEVECREHQNNANIHHQPFPELISEEREIHTDYNRSHCHNVKRETYVSDHFSKDLDSGSEFREQLQIEFAPDFIPMHEF